MTLISIQRSRTLLTFRLLNSSSFNAQKFSDELGWGMGFTRNAAVSCLDLIDTDLEFYKTRSASTEKLRNFVKIAGEVSWAFLLLSWKGSFHIVWAMFFSDWFAVCCNEARVGGRKSASLALKIQIFSLYDWEQKKNSRSTRGFLGVRDVGFFWKHET